MKKNKLVSLQKSISDVTLCEGGATLGLLFGNKKIKQHFLSKERGLAGISLQIGTYLRVNEGYLIMTLKNELKQKVCEGKIKCSLIEDNYWVTFPIEAIANSKNIRYTVEVSSPKARPSKSVTLYYDCSNSEKLYLN